MLQVISGEYQEAVSNTLKSLEQDLSQTLHHISLPPELSTTKKQAAQCHDTSQQKPTQSASPLLDDQLSLQKHASSVDSNFLQDLTARVEHLINVRTALVDAANGMFGAYWLGGII